MIHLPIVILLGGKSSPVALMTGISFSTQMLYHRWVARILLMLTIAHTVGWTVTEARAGYYTETMSDPYIWWGFVGLAFFAMSSILSLTFLRHSCYEVSGVPCSEKATEGGQRALTKSNRFGTDLPRASHRLWCNGTGRHLFPPEPDAREPSLRLL